MLPPWSQSGRGVISSNPSKLVLWPGPVRGLLLISSDAIGVDAAISGPPSLFSDWHFDCMGETECLELPGRPRGEIDIRIERKKKQIENDFQWIPFHFQLMELQLHRFGTAPPQSTSHREYPLSHFWMCSGSGPRRSFWPFQTCKKKTPAYRNLVSN